MFLPDILHQLTTTAHQSSSLSYCLYDSA